MVLAGQVHYGDSNQFLSPQSQSPKRQWRVVQLAAPALRHGHARIPTNCGVPGWDRACDLPKGFMHQVWGHSLHHRWTFLLQLSAHHKCRRSWRCASCVHQGLQHRMASHDKELGSELAEQCQLGCSELVLHGHHW